MNHIILVVALICLFLLVILFWIYVTMQVCRITGRERMLTDLKSRLNWLPIRLEESMLFFGIISWSLFLIARVLNGQCPQGISLWEQQTCNQFASQGGIPTDVAYPLYLSPILLQLFTKNLSICTLVIIQMTTLFVVAFCVIYSNAWSDYPVLINWLFFSNMSFEIERLQRLSFKELIIAKDLQDEAVKGAQEVYRLKQEQERSR